MIGNYYCYLTAVSMVMGQENAGPTVSLRVGFEAFGVLRFKPAGGTHSSAGISTSILAPGQTWCANDVETALIWPYGSCLSQKTGLTPLSESLPMTQDLRSHLPGPPRHHERVACRSTRSTAGTTGATGATGAAGATGATGAGGSAGGAPGALKPKPHKGRSWCLGSEWM